MGDEGARRVGFERLHGAEQFQFDVFVRVGIGVNLLGAAGIGIGRAFFVRGGKRERAARSYGLQLPGGRVHADLDAFVGWRFNITCVSVCVRDSVSTSMPLKAKKLFGKRPCGLRIRRASVGLSICATCQIDQSTSSVPTLTSVLVMVTPLPVSSSAISRRN